MTTIPWGEKKISGCSRAGILPRSKKENICHDFSQEHSHHSFNHFMTLMTGLSLSQQLAEFSPPFPSSPAWRFHLQLLTEVLSIWKAVTAEAKVSCGAPALSKLLLTSLMFITGSLGLFLVASGSPCSHKRSHRVSLAAQGTAQQGLCASVALMSWAFMSWKKVQKYRQWWHRTLLACDSKSYSNSLAYCTKRKNPKPLLCLSYVFVSTFNATLRTVLNAPTSAQKVQSLTVSTAKD